MVFRAAVRFGFALALVCAACSPGNQRGTGAVHAASVISSTLVRVTTDAHEKIVDVAIIRSSGDSAVDRHAVADTKDYWHGAVSSIQKVTVKYTPGPDGQPAPTFQLKLR